MRKGRFVLFLVIFSLSIFLVANVCAVPSVDIKMKNSFSLGEQISFEYSFSDKQEENIEYVASYNCPSAPLEQPEFQKITVQKEKTTKLTKSILGVQEWFEPQTCEAYVFVRSGKEEKTFAKKFDIAKDKAFQFEGKINRKVFIKGENIDLSYNSNYQDARVNAVLVFPNNEKKAITLPYSLSAGQSGKYLLEITAVRNAKDIKSNSEKIWKTEKKSKIDFSVIEMQPQFFDVPSEKTADSPFQTENADELSAGTDGYFYMNYTKPAKALNATWQVRHGTLPTYNISIPSECFSADSQKLILKIESNSNNGMGQAISRPFCWNGTEWEAIGNVSAGDWITMYEPIYCRDIPESDGGKVSDGNWSSFSQRSVVYCVKDDDKEEERGAIFDDIHVPNNYNGAVPESRVYEEEMAWTLRSGNLGKDMSRYANGEVFIITDSSWQDIFQLVPVTTWRETNSTVLSACKKGFGTYNDTCVYPSLIFHDEGSGFDADSTIHFLQQYPVSNITLVGNTPANFDSLLTAAYPTGAGLSSEQIKRVDSANLLDYWGNYNNVTYSQDDYETAILASTYASLRNTPLIIQGSSLDIDSSFAGKNITCIGDLSGSGRACMKNYTIEQLKAQYKNETNSTRMIIINPDDWTIYLNSAFTPDKSSTIYNVYTKNSLAAPFLASAKKEIIISQHETGGDGNEDMSNVTWTRVLAIQSFVKNETNKFKLNASNFNNSYLTVIASQNAIQVRFKRPNLGGSVNHQALDPTAYADYNNDSKPDLIVGRLMGISVSDVSSQVATNLFYNDTRRNNLNMNFFGANITGSLQAIYDANNWTVKFKNSSYNAANITSLINGFHFDPANYSDELLISYHGHGNSLGWSGIDYNDIPDQNSTLFFSDSCLNCYVSASTPTNTFCNHAVRHGVVFHSGTVSVSWGGDAMYKTIMNGTFYLNITAGKAFKNGFSNDTGRWMNMFQGDPTFYPSPKYNLKQAL